jgi:hypothetical protein
VTFLEEQIGPWKPVSRAAAIGWLVFYTMFFLYAAFNRSGFLFFDYVNLIIHEGGHFVFSWFGYTITILGGTLGELFVPLLCGLYFFRQCELTAVAFCSFWFFENFRTSARTWRPRELWRCRWSAPAITTGKFCLDGGECCSTSSASGELQEI